MINRLRRKPKKWLTLEDCEGLFRAYRTRATVAGLAPFPPFESRYKNVLESILGSVEMSWENKLLNPTILDVASQYFNKFIRGQAFMNGNKRMGVLFTHYFLIKNEIDFTFKYGELFFFAAEIARLAEKGVKDETTLRLCRKIMIIYTKEI